MAGTNAYVAKKALMDALAASPSLTGIQVAYSWPGDDAGREVVHAGKTTWDTEPMAFRSGGRLPRREELTVEVHVVVMMPGSVPGDAESRAVVLGTVIEELLASNTDLSATPGLRMAGVTGGEMEHGFTDDEVIAVLTYRVVFVSELR